MALRVPGHCTAPAPLGNGAEVEVLILSKQERASIGPSAALEGSVLEYRDPFEPVAAEDWEAMTEVI